jgi:hypothetical protein
LHACRREADISFLTRLLFAAYFLEAGLILIVAPWSAFWDRNLFFGTLPSLAPILQMPFARGAVTGIGVITVLAGLGELAGLLSLRHRPPSQDAPRVEL